MTDTLGPDPDDVGYDTCLNDSTTIGGGGPGGSNGVAGTFCDLDVTNNVWVEGVVDVPAGKMGICMLNSLSRAQIVDVLRHNPKARADLPKVTSDTELLGLLATVPLLGGEEIADLETRKSARSGLPYYNLFAGRPPVARPFKKP